MRLGAEEGDHHLPPHPRGDAGLGGGDPGGRGRGREHHLSGGTPGSAYLGDGQRGRVCAAFACS
ncbi:MAG: hypothetical protein MZV70_44705 [Desulfobacterales bacterium]|nr:hypothetical protein [Desulfobacterales bacterium]